MKTKYTIIHKDNTIGYIKAWDLKDAQAKARYYDAVLMENETVDNVNSPTHYTSHPSGVECITITEHYDFCVGNAIKYLWRAGLKGDSTLGNAEKELEDVKKALWYVQRHISNLEKKCNTK